MIEVPEGCTPGMLPAFGSTLPCITICLVMRVSGHFFFRSTKTLPTTPARSGVPVAAACTPPSIRASLGAAIISLAIRFRLSFCCERDGCRKRVTPPSVRFLGRKVYLDAVVILVAAMRQGPSPRRVRELSQLFVADRRTIARWQVFWEEHFPQTQFWKVARGRLCRLRRQDPSAITSRSLSRPQDPSNDSWGRLLGFLCSS